MCFFSQLYASDAINPNLDSYGARLDQLYAKLKRLRNLRFLKMKVIDAVFEIFCKMRPHNLETTEEAKLEEAPKRKWRKVLLKSNSFDIFNIPELEEPVLEPGKYTDEPEQDTKLLPESRVRLFRVTSLQYLNKKSFKCMATFEEEYKIDETSIFSSRAVIEREDIPSDHVNVFSTIIINWTKGPNCYLNESPELT